MPVRLPSAEGERGRIHTTRRRSQVASETPRASKRRPVPFRQVSRFADSPSSDGGHPGATSVCINGLTFGRYVGDCGATARGGYENRTLGTSGHGAIRRSGRGHAGYVARHRVGRSSSRQARRRERQSEILHVSVRTTFCAITLMNPVLSLRFAASQTRARSSALPLPASPTAHRFSRRWYPSTSRCRMAPAWKKLSWDLQMAPSR